MKLPTLLLASIALLAINTTAAPAPAVPAYISNAIADSHRPASDTDQDADRKPAAVVMFTGIKPGQSVVDLMPGYGYYTRIFSKIIGRKGKVFAVEPEELSQRFPKGLAAVESLADLPEYKNVIVLVQPVAKIILPERVDVIFTSMNYHDLHNPLLGSPDMAAFNKSMFAALKPGGIFLVLDHAAAKGAGFIVTNTLHRAEPAAVKAEVMAAGFEFAGESEVLRNPDDDHSLNVFDKSIRGKTDRFIYKFRKPVH